MEKKTVTQNKTMNGNFIELFDVNKDAVYTNRGFYYQYLTTLKSWIKNFIENKDIVTYTEVDNDIKEVGEILYFKQIKCYTRSLSFNSKELQKSIFDFFILYCKYDVQEQQQRFCFSTNTSLAKKEKLLHAWINDPMLADNDLKQKAHKKIQKLLSAEFNQRKNKKLSAGAVRQKEALKDVASTLKDFLGSEQLFDFVERLDWEFNNLDPTSAVANLELKNIELLGNEIFGNRPPSLLMNALLTVIYKRSQDNAPEQRSLSNGDIHSILVKTDQEIEMIVDNRLVELLGLEFTYLKNKIQELFSTQEHHTREIAELKKNVPEESVAVRELTFIPEVMTGQFIGRDEDLISIKDLLSNHGKITVQGIGGIGKTTLVAKYVEGLHEKDHIIWITVEESLLNAFVLEELLLENLRLSFSSETPEMSFNLIANKINNIPGDNLIVIDMQACAEGITLLQRIKWPMIIVTRQDIFPIPSLKINCFSFSQAKTIYNLHSNRHIGSDETLLRFFEYVSYNTLVIELTAKTIEASYDLTLEMFLELLLNQNLNDAQLEVDISRGYDEHSVRIFKALQQTFEVKGLKSKDRYYLEFLALLPSTNIVVEELIAICGKESFDKNKISINNYLNTLSKKGWIEYSNDRKRISVHRIIQEMILYKERDSISPFMPSMLYIIWLRARLVEGTNNPAKSFSYLKYAESILSAIKEKYRFSLYQPLLLLENEVLYSLGFYYKPKNQLERWIDLNRRAANFAGLDEQNKGAIANNLALSLRDNGDINQAVEQFGRAILIGRKGLPETADILLIYLNNLCQTYLENGLLTIALKIFEQVRATRKKYNIINDQQLSIEYQIVARAHYHNGNLDDAISFINQAIAQHKSLAIDNRNDYYLAYYHDTISVYHLENNDIAQALVNQKIAVNIIEAAGLGNSFITRQMYRKLLALYTFTRNEKKIEFINEKLQKIAVEFTT